jgi:general stress protein 26
MGQPLEPFDAIRDDFLRFTADVVLCTATTVDPRGRPRSRILHPIFTVVDGQPVGWVLTGRDTLKARHLAANPHVACSYWSPAQNVVHVDCLASWVDDPAEKRRVWDLFMTTPPPLGYDLVQGYGSLDNPIFTPLRLDPYRIQVLRGEEYPWGNLTPRIWRSAAPTA